VSLQTEFDFVRPNGYVDGEGALHKIGGCGWLRRDEVEPQ